MIDFNKAPFRKLIFKFISLLLIVIFVTVCSDDTPTDAVDSGKWITTTITPTSGTYGDCSYLIKYHNDIFHGQYKAELYFENEEGARYHSTPFFEGGDCDIWMMRLYLYEGRIEFRYPGWWDTNPRKVHILVIYRED